MVEHPHQARSAYRQFEALPEDGQAARRDLDGQVAGRAQGARRQRERALGAEGYEVKLNFLKEFFFLKLHKSHDLHLE